MILTVEMADFQAEIEALDNNEHYIDYTLRINAAAVDPNNPEAQKAAEKLTNMKLSYLNDNYNVVLDRYRHYMQPHFAPEMGYYDHAQNTIRPVLLHLINLMTYVVGDNEALRAIVPVAPR